MPDSSLTPHLLQQQRERTIAALCDHFAHDHLEAEDLERLIDSAHAASSLAELERLLVPLPALTAATDGRYGSSLALPEEVDRQQFVVAVMGGNERKGAWTPARQVHTIAVMGGAVLDFRQARFGPGVTEVYCLAVMGGIEIVVPAGVRVESDGIGIMGGFEHHTPSARPPGSGGPVLRVRGLALMGGVEITEREVGESAREARARIRGERRRLRGGSGYGQER